MFLFTSINHITIGPSSSALPGDFQQRLFHELAEDPHESVFVLSGNPTSSSSPIVIHGSDSESDKTGVVNSEEDDEGFDSTLHLGERSVTSTVPMSAEMENVKDELATNCSTAGASASVECTNFSEQSENLIPTSDNEKGHRVKSKGKSKMGSDGARLKKILKSAHKRNHRHSHKSSKHKRSRSTDRYDLPVEGGEGGYRGGSVGPSSPWEKHHKSREHRRHQEEKDRKFKDNDASPHSSQVSETIAETSEQLIQEARAIEEEIRASKREILKSAIKKERIELLHRNMHGSSLQGREGVANGRGVTDETETDVMLWGELDQLNKEIRSKKKQLLSVVKHMEDELT